LVTPVSRTGKGSPERSSGRFTRRRYGVVVGRDRPELCDLFAAKAGDSPLGPTLGQVDVARAQPGTACPQERAELVLIRSSAAHRGHILAEAGRLLRGRHLTVVAGKRSAASRQASHGSYGAILSAGLDLALFRP
jgi:hypothetical protein